MHYENIPSARPRCNYALASANKPDPEICLSVILLWYTDPVDGVNNPDRHGISRLTHFLPTTTEYFPTKNKTKRLHRAQKRRTKEQ